MVRRKRRGTTRRRRPATVNPRRRRRTVAAAPRRRRRALLSLNPRRRRRRAVSNPHHRRHRRRRNPSATGLVKDALWAGFGAFATNFVSGFIPLGGGGWIDVLKQLGAAWLVGFIGEKVPFIGASNARLMSIGGAAGAAWSGANMLLSGASGFLTPHPAAAPGVAGWLGDISTYPAGSGGGQLGDIVNAPEWYGDASMRNG